jgi:16S rRNA C967 or C1407 C5-methylase (RsmB/RsmF family)
MKQKDRAEKLTGETGFEQYYSSLCKERWPELKKALLEPTVSAEYRAGGKESYFLDTASIRAAVSLPLSGAASILDMCAAPGGKTVVISSLMDESACLLSNERSPDRKLRLSHTVQNCLPESIQEKITVICKDGAVLCLSKNNRFDRILLDAPCSSERHVLSSPDYLKDWSPKRIKSLSMSQWALLSSAWRMLNPGGYMVYSTCALTDEENDRVVEKLFKKFDDVQVLNPKISADVSVFCSASLPEGEKTQYGCHILPDKAGGAGPLYFSLLYKRNTEKN